MWYEKLRPGHISSRIAHLLRKSAPQRVRNSPEPNGRCCGIAEAMGVEVTTVKYHVTNMLQKTNLENKLQLALAVSEAKMIADLAEE